MFHRLGMIQSVQSDMTENVIIVIYTKHFSLFKLGLNLVKKYIKILIIL